jgi:hypothetical protein
MSSFTTVCGVLSVDDRAERHFRRVGQSDLPHEDQVERGTKPPRDLDGDRHAAPGQRVDHGSLPCQSGQLLGKLSARFETIRKSVCLNQHG